MEAVWRWEHLPPAVCPLVLWLKAGPFGLVFGDSAKAPEAGTAGEQAAEAHEPTLENSFQTTQ